MITNARAFLSRRVAAPALSVCSMMPSTTSCGKRSGGNALTTKNQHTGSITTETGTPTFIQSRKPTSTPDICSTVMLFGPPASVAKPPTMEAYRSPMNRQRPKLLFSGLQPRASRMPLANPMNMSTAAVSDMTLESSAAAAMNASTISRESPLVRFMRNTTRRMP